MKVLDMDKIKGMLKEPFVDEQRAKSIRMGLVKAYCYKDSMRTRRAVLEAQRYVDEGGDFPLSFWQYDDTIEDYSGNDADMLAEKYLVRLLHDRYCDYDDDQEYIRTGLCKAITPAMRQFLQFKEKHPDAIFLFRCGDYYEAYDEDAKVCAKILSIGTTTGEIGTTASFPHHALDTYLPKLIRAGKRVAICDQLEDPKLTKKLVKRGITELVTPQKPQQPQHKERKQAIQLTLDF